MLSSRISLVFLLLVIFLLAPAYASLEKVNSGAPVFIGERNLDVTAALNGHSVIAWWPQGSDLTTSPSQTVTITGSQTSYYIDPALFTGYTGTWYSYDTKPNVPVFVVYQPQINLSIWDVDTNTDITGQSIPMSTNITYHIDTNLWMVYNYSERPNANPSDSFLMVTLTSPSGDNIPHIFTGNVGNPTTRILPFNNNPIITSSPYIWTDGPSWYRNAISTDGSKVYQAGTYTFIVSQNLDGMSDSYPNETAIGNVTSGDKTITFTVAAYAIPTTVLPTVTAPAATTPATPITTVASTIQPTATVIPKKTTYSPMPEYIAILGLGIAAFAFAMRRKY
ncbi:DUF3821 domain-containing protein [Methanoregula sp.]|jgi:hypothetical protein|uniref:DUF3821 domain-containing protein n=1 Tax=Methanoregula sp. TaxID=2052170 RepID=UPI003C1EEB36